MAKIPKTDDIAPEPEREDQGMPGESEAYIFNKYYDKELLTPEEALDQINSLSGMLLIDGRYRRKKEHRGNLQTEKGGGVRPVSEVGGDRP